MVRLMPILYPISDQPPTSSGLFFPASATVRSTQSIMFQIADEQGQPGPAENRLQEMAIGVFLRHPCSNNIYGHLCNVVSNRTEYQRYTRQIHKCGVLARPDEVLYNRSVTQCVS